MNEVYLCKLFTATIMSQESGVEAVSKTCFTMATDAILETLATKYPQVMIVKLGIKFWKKKTVVLATCKTAKLGRC